MSKGRYQGAAVRVKTAPDAHAIAEGVVQITKNGGHPRVKEGDVIHEDHARSVELDLDIDECHAFVPETARIAEIPGLGQRQKHGGWRW
jgi:hypothetical protein